MTIDEKTLTLANTYGPRYRQHARAACQEERYKYLGVEVDIRLDGAAIDYPFLEAVERAAGCRPDQVGEYRWACAHGYDDKPAAGCKSLYMACVTFARQVRAEARKKGLDD
jgi:hypothetical protein